MTHFAATPPLPP